MALRGRNAWFYHNSETKQKARREERRRTGLTQVVLQVWKPPTVPGWIIKTGSGDHPPYGEGFSGVGARADLRAVGLLHYYFNPESGQIAYEPPNA
eukprot:767237-Hanusia_phi.AAC.2